MFKKLNVMMLAALFLFQALVPAGFAAQPTAGGPSNLTPTQTLQNAQNQSSEESYEEGEEEVEESPLSQASVEVQTEDSNGPVVEKGDVEDNSDYEYQVCKDNDPNFFVLKIFKKVKLKGHDSKAKAVFSVKIKKQEGETSYKKFFSISGDGRYLAIAGHLLKSDPKLSAIFGALHDSILLCDLKSGKFVKKFVLKTGDSRLVFRISFKYKAGNKIVVKVKYKLKVNKKVVEKDKFKKVIKL